MDYAYALIDHNGDTLEEFSLWWQACARFREHGYPEGWCIIDNDSDEHTHRDYFVKDSD